MLEFFLPGFGLQLPRINPATAGREAICEANLTGDKRRRARVRMASYALLDQGSGFVICGYDAGEDFRARKSLSSVRSISSSRLKIASRSVSRADSFTEDRDSQRNGVAGGGGARSG